MTFQNIKKMIVGAFLLGSCFCFHQTLSADPLVFKVGDAASYTVTQTTDCQNKWLSGVFGTERNRYEDTIAFTVKILSSDAETLSYPFDVELTMKGIRINNTETSGDETKTVSYDSDNPLDADKYTWAKHLANLINVPMHFRVNGEFDVKEVTGLLERERTALDDLSSKYFFGTTPWSFELLLTQLFHLSGEEMQPSVAYPVSCYQLIDWEDEKIKIEEYDLRQNGGYVISSVDPETIEGIWQEVAVIKGDKTAIDLSKAAISVDGNVKWNAANPLIQQREMNACINARYSFIVRQKFSAKQVWRSTPL